MSRLVAHLLDRSSIVGGPSFYYTITYFIGIKFCLVGTLREPP
jgi:hypothetical protein